MNNKKLAVLFSLTGLAIVWFAPSIYFDKNDISETAQTLKTLRYLLIGFLLCLWGKTFYFKNQ